MKNRIMSLLAVAVIAVSLTITGCSASQPTVNNGKTLYDHGLELVSIIEEMAESEEYIAVYTGSPRISDVISDFGDGDYSSPSKVYRLEPAAEIIAEYAHSAELSGMSDKVKDMVFAKTIAALATQANAVDGAENLAATTVCTAGKTFVNSEISDPVIYVYVYDNGYPVAVTFTAGENSTVSASAMFISCSIFDTSSVQAIDEFFGGMVKAEEITE